MTTITSRRIREGDLPFLLNLYGTTRERELNNTDLSPEERRAFVQQQFHAQHAYYHMQFPTAEYAVLQLGKTDIGREYVDFRPGEIGLMDICLLPEFQNQGLGSQRMDALKATARKLQKDIVLHVEVNNPDAYRFYLRHGFQPEERLEFHVRMRWKPDHQVNESPHPSREAG